MSHATRPDLLAEWHQESRRVYVVVLPGRWQDGQWVPDLTKKSAKGILAGEGIVTHEQFASIFRAFLSGIKYGEQQACTRP